MKSKWVARASAFDTFKNFDHNDLTAKHCYYRRSRPSDVDGIKTFYKDDQAAVHCSFYLSVLQPGHLYKKF